MTLKGCLLAAVYSPTICPSVFSWDMRPQSEPSPASENTLDFSEPEVGIRAMGPRFAKTDLPDFPLVKSSLLESEPLLPIGCALITTDGRYVLLIQRVKTEVWIEENTYTTDESDQIWVYDLQKEELNKIHLNIDEKYQAYATSFLDNNHVFVLTIVVGDGVKHLSGLATRRICILNAETGSFQLYSDPDHKIRFATFIEYQHKNVLLFAGKEDFFLLDTDNFNFTKAEFLYPQGKRINFLPFFNREMSKCIAFDSSQQGKIVIERVDPKTLIKSPMIELPFSHPDDRLFTHFFRCIWDPSDRYVVFTTMNFCLDKGVLWLLDTQSAQLKSIMEGHNVSRSFFSWGMPQ